MPKMCERGYAQNFSIKTGNSQEVKGYAHVQIYFFPASARAKTVLNKMYERKGKKKYILYIIINFFALNCISS